MSRSNRPNRNRKLKNEVGIVVFLLIVLGLVSYVVDKLPSNGPENAAKPVGAPSEAATRDLMIDESALSSTDRATLTVLRDIVATGKDHDPRLDTGFSEMSDALRAAIRAECRITEREKFRARGVLVHALGRSLRSETDVAFMGDVLREEPCLSVADCRQPPARGETTGLAGDETSVIHPQLMALRSLQVAYEAISASASPFLVRIRRELHLVQASSAPDRIKTEVTRLLETWKTQDRAIKQTRQTEDALSR